MKALLNRNALLYCTESADNAVIAGNGVVEVVGAGVVVVEVVGTLGFACGVVADKLIPDNPNNCDQLIPAFSGSVPGIAEILMARVNTGEPERFEYVKRAPYAEVSYNPVPNTDCPDNPIENPSPAIALSKVLPVSTNVLKLPGIPSWSVTLNPQTDNDLKIANV